MSILFEAKNKVLECASFLCGLIRDKEDSMLGDLQFIDDFNLYHLREERLIRALFYEVQ